MVWMTLLPSVSVSGVVHALTRLAIAIYIQRGFWLPSHLLPIIPRTRRLACYHAICFRAVCHSMCDDAPAPTNGCVASVLVTGLSGVRLQLL